MGLPLLSLPVDWQNVVAQFATAVVISGCPTTTSAGWSIAVGMLFQISTRLKPRSAMNRCVPSEVTEVGL